MQQLDHSFNVLDQDIQKFENSRKKVVSFVKFYGSLQKQIVVVQPYFKGIVLFFHLNKIRISPKELKKNIFSIFAVLGWAIDQITGGK
jgi:hypothetical protein